MAETYIIAVDFGTTFSGYAFSLSPSHKDPEPQVRRWGHEQGQDTPKTPTCILFDHHGHFLHFGYEAKSTYLETDKDEATKFYYFENFKMELYNKTITNDLQIRDVKRRPMSAMKVFSAALRFLKDDAVRTINDHSTNFEFTASDFTWVLTVPAIWDAAAKQFMREAAEQAGIVSRFSPEKLLIALEPEAASVWCRKLPSEGFISEFSQKTRLSESPGTKYIVVDCGGGTIDITVHELLEGGRLKELHKASGNDRGGQHVDRLFKESLREYLRGGQWDQYERNHPSEAQKLLNDFAIAKQFARKPKPINLICDSRLGDIIKSNQSFKKMEGLKWENGRILISQSKMLWFFQDSLDHIVKSIDEVLSRLGGVDFLLLVGGFAQCQILREKIHKRFCDKVQDLCPLNPQEVILKGAVLFGRDPSVIRSRKSAYTYGLATRILFDPSKHKPEKKITNDWGDRCDDIFKKLVEIDEDVKWDETRDFKFVPGNKNQTSCRFSFYRTKTLNPTYVDDSGVTGPVASCVVEMPDTTKGLDREINLQVFFGATEITAKVTDVESKCTTSANFDFFSR